MSQASKSQFKAEALEFFRQIESSGQPMMITDHGEPILEVRLYRAALQDPLATLRGLVLRYQNPTEPVGMGDWDVSP